MLEKLLEYYVVNAWRCISEHVALGGLSQHILSMTVKRKSYIKVVVATTLFVKTRNLQYLP